MVQLLVEVIIVVVEVGPPRIIVRVDVDQTQEEHRRSNVSLVDEVYKVSDAFIRQ